jgi:beta-xylosidase
MNKREQLMADLERINRQLDTFEKYGRHEMAEELINKNRWVLDYDAKGNWVGSVANESGWQA